MCTKKKIIFILGVSFILNTYILANELIIPKSKPKIEGNIKKYIEILLPKKKPASTIVVDEKEQDKKEIDKSKIDSKDLVILPKKKPLIYQKTKIKNRVRSKYFSENDYSIARRAVIAMEKGNWKKSLDIAKKSKNKSIHNFITWKHLLTQGNKATFYEYLNFINKYKYYPRINRIKYLAEHKLSTDIIDPKKIIKWFDNTPPLSGYGKLILGESKIKNGDINIGVSLIKEGWISAKLSRKDLKYFRKKYKKYLSTDDYIKRADYLAWENKYWDLKRMLRYLPKDYQMLYTARQLLMSKSYGVDKAISKVPEKFMNDAGLNYDRLKWRRKRGRVDSSLEILLKIENTKDYLVRPDKWWKERSIISRSLIYRKKYELAYKICSNHAMTNGPEYAESEWMSGWIALSFLNDPILAIEHFNNFYNNVGYPISLSRGAYWLGKAYKKLEKNELSHQWYSEASKYMTTYYGQLAHLEISPNESFSLNNIPEVPQIYKKAFHLYELTKLVYLLDELNRDKYAKDILKHLSQDNIASGSEILAGKLAIDIGRYDFGIQIAKKASYEKRFINEINYPIISTPIKINKKKMPDQNLILAVIRQESEFDSKANSSAGAKGMMQLMTYTARLISKQAKLPYSKSKLTSNPEYNINLGSYYLATLLEEYDGSYPFALAAYNAGPKRVRYWKKINKNPQKKQIDYVNWIELIKFKETRNYVQRVLENVNVYKYIIAGEPVKVFNFFKDKPLY